MTQAEIQLFNELIRETVKSALKDQRQLIKEDLAKDLKEVKLLLAKVIKENKQIKDAVLVEGAYVDQSQYLTPEKQSGLMEIVNAPSPARNRELPDHLKIPSSKYKIPEWKQAAAQINQQEKKIDDGVNTIVKQFGINTNAKKLQNVLAQTAIDMSSAFDDPLLTLASNLEERAMASAQSPM